MPKTPGFFPNRIDRRAVVAGLAAALAPLPPFTLHAAETVTDATNRSFAVPDHVARVYPAGPPAAVTVYTIAPDLMLGWLEPIPASGRDLVLPAAAALPMVPRLTGRSGNINIEALTAQKPDIIVDVGNVDSSFASLAERVQQQTNIPYVLFDGHLERIAATYRALGRLLGRNEQGEKLAGYAEQTLATVKQRGDAVPADKRPRLYYTRDRSGLQTGFGGSMISEPIEFIGAHNVAAALHGAHGTATAEQVREWDPEIIIAGDADFAASVRSDPAWASIAAVKNGRVHLAPRQPFGWVDYPPAANRLIGLMWLGKILYPDRFPEDIKALARDFYATFYHVTPTAEQIDRVLAGSL